MAAYPRTWGPDYCLLPPGRVFSYSNAGYALAGLALQQREKKPFADVVRARVLEPLGMPRSTFRPTEAMTYPSLPAGDLNDYVGTDANPRRFTVEVMRQGDQLVLRRFGRDFPMRPVTVDQLVVDRPGGGEEAIAFGLRPDGSVP